MTVIMRRRKIVKIVIGFASFASLRYIQLPNDAAKLSSLAIFGCVADKDDLELVISFLLTPVILPLLKKMESSLIEKGLFALCSSYITLEGMHHPDTVPRNSRGFYDRNCGASKEVMARIRRDCAEHGWVTKEFSNTISRATAAFLSMRRTAISTGKLKLLTEMMRLIVTRKSKFDLRSNLLEWARTFLFCHSLFMLHGFLGVIQYNRWMSRFIESDNIEDYKPSFRFQWTMFSLFAFIAVHIESKSKHKLLASYYFIQAVITRMNLNELSIKHFVPLIFYFSCNCWHFVVSEMQTISGLYFYVFTHHAFCIILFSRSDRDVIWMGHLY